ncbi:MAG: tRNA (N6-isopentenyl adenosine(37)-C2)-methylthiotransferase MiaB [Phycisphaerae bacterium]|nr:tRNA (N6-isopentenyl adenosine(37)-C2)-methylthiotransferase MiaB [Phycisphaerae bacterium]
MNRLDSELVVSALRAAGHEMVDDSRQAQVVLFNTCSVRRQAENKVYSRLGAEAQRKAAGKQFFVGVLGCMAQREGADLMKKYPVDLVCAPGQLDALPRLIEQAAAGQAAMKLDPSRKEPRDRAADERLEQLDLGRDPAATPSPVQAYVRVSRGCDKFCSYCVVPFVRGGEISRHPANILDETRRLVDAGRSEITLLGQTVNSYRWRPAGEGAMTTFADLLALLSPIAGLRRLRFVTSHPIDFGDDILHAMRDLPNLCRYIHVPAQSGSDAMLRAMNRKYTRAQYDDLADRARAIVPGVVLAGDFIVGFPGETDADHAASQDLIRRSGYKNSFIFKYSPRPGTAAAKTLKDDVPTHVKRARNADLLAVQAEVSLTHHQSCIGQTVEVLVEGPSPRANKQPHRPAAGEVQLIGRTRGDHIVVFDGPPSLTHQYIDVTITGATALTLFAKKGI